MNPYLNRLQPYPFEKLNAIKAGVTPPQLPPISLAMGEPKHAAPAFVKTLLTDNLDKLSNYPATRGSDDLLMAMADWTCQRFHLQAFDYRSQILPVNGTREALFAFVQAIIDSRDGSALVLSPNPFYQIYEGATLLSGAKPYFLATNPDTGFLPDFDAVPADIWQRCQCLFVCSPGNPTGAVMSIKQFQRLIDLADQYDFVIASDECYSELYFDVPPPGLLQACVEMGRHDYARCAVFHSLSKRSNLPGLRSGFVAGDARLMEAFLLYRTYHGCAMPLQHQVVSAAVWRDEEHVKQNRVMYQQKFDAVLDILSGYLDVQRPEASFYLWPRTPIDDIEFARRLYAEQNVTVLPGQFLARDVNGHNPGQNRVRMALVATLDECTEAAERIRQFCAQL